MHTDARKTLDLREVCLFQQCCTRIIYRLLNLISPYYIIVGYALLHQLLYQRSNWSNLLKQTLTNSHKSQQNDKVVG